MEHDQMVHGKLEGNSEDSEGEDELAHLVDDSDDVEEMKSMEEDGLNEFRGLEENDEEGEGYVLKYQFLLLIVVLNFILKF
jgi:hypothetical protein